MSWSVEVVGQRAAVATKAAEMFDGAAKNYAGSEEEKDILAVKERALAAITAIEATTYANGVKVSASGSRSSYSVSLTLSVQPCQVAIDEAPAQAVQPPAPPPPVTG